MFDRWWSLRGGKRLVRELASPAFEPLVAGHDALGADMDPKAREELRITPTGPPSSGADLPPSPRDDVDLARAAARGEPEHVRRLVRRLACVPRMLGALNQRSGRPLDEHELADLVQEVLLRVWAKLDGYEGLASLESWTWGILSLEFQNARRKSFALRRVASLEESDPAERAPRERERAEVVAWAMERLEPQEASIVRLRHYEDLTHEEIAVRTGLSIGAVKLRYYRAVERLTDLLRTRIDRPGGTR